MSCCNKTQKASAASQKSCCQTPAKSPAKAALKSCCQKTASSQLKNSGTGCSPASSLSSAQTQSCCSSSQSTSQTNTSPPPGQREALPQDDEEEPIGSDLNLKRQTWNVEGMDCPSCASKLEQALTRLEGVQQASVTFALSRLHIAYEPALCSEASVLAAANKLDFQLVQTGRRHNNTENSGWLSQIKRYQQLVVFAVLLLTALALTLLDPELKRTAFTVVSLWGLIPVLKKSIAGIRSGVPFSIETLMSVAAMGAIALGDSAEAAMVLFLFMLGEQLERYAAGRARKGVEGLLALVPETATLITNGQRQQVAIDSLKPGDTIEALPGDRLPADGQLLSEQGSFDESPLTGESIPIERSCGEPVMAGSLVESHPVQIEVRSEPGHNAVDRIIHLIEEAEERKAPIERFIDRFSRWYTPLMMLVAGLIMVLPPLLLAQSWSEWIYKGLTLLLIACPCALVISTPAAITSALAAAARQGLLIKGGATMEQLAHIKGIAFDKTGTLTKGQPSVRDIQPLPNFGGDEAQLLALAAAIEQGSNHPLAKAICHAAEARQLPLPEPKQVKVMSGIGISASIDHQHYQIIAPRHYQAALSNNVEKAITDYQQQGKTVALIIQDNTPIGLITLRDELRTDAGHAMAALNELGVSGTMLTGDNQQTANALAQKLGIAYQAELLPEDKVKAIHTLAEQHPVAMVGDGINDAPALKSASVGISMGSGSDVALETADCAISHNRLDSLPKLIELARATMANIHQNIAIALGLKGLFLITTILGLTGLWIAILADTGATALVTANALRLLKK